jgi:protein SCO1
VIEFLSVKRFLRHIALAACAILWMVASGPLWAQRSGQQLEALEGVGMESNLGSMLPKDLVFRDETGREVTIGSYLDGQTPVLLNFAYHNCPMLCSFLLSGVSKAVGEMEWVPGTEFHMVTVSFAPDEGPDLAARAKQRYVGELGKPQAAAGWHFLTGSESNIQQLAAAVGFQFKWVEEQQEYAHPAALIFVSGEGKITRYLYGIDFSPRDVRAALVEASQGAVGTPLDQIFLYCFRYDQASNSYVLYATNVMKLGGLLTVLTMGGVLFLLWRRERSNLEQIGEDVEGAAVPSPSHS